MSEAPIQEAELLILVMDGSSSMSTGDTFDARQRADHLHDLVKATLERLAKSEREPAYRVSLIYFSDKVFLIEKNREKYFRLDEALKLIKHPLKVTDGGQTSIAGALRNAFEIINGFNEDDALPQNKRITIFLFTDGEENVETDTAVRDVASQIKSHPLSPMLATASFGTSEEVNKDLLKEIASESSERQRRHLKLGGVIHHLISDKLCIEGNVGGEITKEKAEALRNFVYVLSRTKKE